MADLTLALNILIAALGTYRVARMLATETGPFALFRLMRGKIAYKFRPRGMYQHWVDEGFNCPLCIGFYASFVLFGLLYVDYVKFGVYGLAVAGLQVFIQTIEKR